MQISKKNEKNTNLASQNEENGTNLLGHYRKKATKKTKMNSKYIKEENKSKKF